MPIMTLVWRVLLFWFSMSLPMAVLGLAIGGIKGAVVAELLLFLAMAGAAFRSEKGFIKAYRARTGSAKGVRRSLDRVIDQLGGNAPAVRVFADPVPQALVLRGPASRGVILLSEGLLGLLDEAQLRGVLSECVRQVRSRGMGFRTLCAWLAHSILDCAPESWTHLFFGERTHLSARMSAVSALLFAPLLSVSCFLVSLGRAPRGTESSIVDAPQIYRRFGRIPGALSNPASGVLHLADPWVDRALFRL